ncbi:MAG TPA: phospholipid carrier-dependent glycosyltransferase [Patescibacteria group bacterium]
MKKIKNNIIGFLLKNKYLVLILVLGAVLRFSYLNFVPPSLNWDEVSHGYNAYSILKTGKDEWGQAFPIANFRAYGDYPLPLNLYLTIPFIAVFGLNEVAIRFPHAFLGTLTIVSVYFLALGITKNRKIALIGSFFAAIDPWLLFPSRAVFQSNLSVFFLTTAMAVFFNREKNRWFTPISFLFLGSTLFSYHSTRIFSPLILVGLLLIYRKEFIQKISRRSVEIVVSFAFILLFFAPLPFILLNPQARARSNVVFLIDQGAINQINDLRNSSKLPFKSLLYNKATYLSVNFARNYINYFSPSFLFLKGGTQYQFSVPNHGVLYLAELPFFYLGLFILIKKAIKDRDWRLLLLWLILAPIPAAITQDESALIRATTLLPIPQILSAVGLVEVIKRMPKYRVFVSLLFGGVMFILLGNYLNVYANSYRNNYSWAWQYGYKEVYSYANENSSQYEKIIVTKKYGEPHEFLLFFSGWSPEKYRNDPNLIRFFQSNWYWVDRFDKFYFVNDWQIPKEGTTFVLESKKENVDCSKTKCLLITSPGNYPKGWKLLKTYDFLDGKKAFEIYSN